MKRDPGEMAKEWMVKRMEHDKLFNELFVPGGEEPPSIEDIGKLVKLNEQAYFAYRDWMISFTKTYNKKPSDLVKKWLEKRNEHDQLFVKLFSANTDEIKNNEKEIKIPDYEDVLELDRLNEEAHTYYRVWVEALLEIYRHKN